MILSRSRSKQQYAPPAGALLECALAVNRMAGQLGRIYEVSAREVVAIMELATSGPFSASELADRMYLTRGAVTGLVRRLVEQGWMESSPDPLDGRRVVIHATPRAHSLLQAWAEQFASDVAARVGATAIAGIGEALDHCTGELEAHRAVLRRLGPAEVRELMRLD